MKFNEFAEEIKLQLEEILKQESTVAIHSVTKNNGVVLHGITITNGKRNISPTIYLEEFYGEFLKGKKIPEIAGEIYGIYEHDTYKENLDLSFFTDYENAKDNIVYKLVNYEKNKELLKEVPHVRYLDLAIVFYCLVKNEELGNATILIRNNHLSLWKQNANAIYNVARNNTPKLLPPDLRSMEEILEELLAVREEDEDGMACDITETGMYVLTNKSRMYGASVIMYEHVLSSFAGQKKRDLIILPSSIHEVILIPYEDNHDREYLKQMVADVNRTQVDAQEVLSDQVYMYIRDEKKIVCM